MSKCRGRYSVTSILSAAVDMMPRWDHSGGGMDVVIVMVKGIVCDVVEIKRTGSA